MYLINSQIKLLLNLANQLKINNKIKITKILIN